MLSCIACQIRTYVLNDKCVACGYDHVRLPDVAYLHGAADFYLVAVNRSWSSVGGAHAYLAALPPSL